MVPQSRITRSRVSSTRIVKVEEVAPSLKYAVHPGFLGWNGDGKARFMPSHALIQFYGVDPAECIVVSRNAKDYAQRHAKALELALIPLHPKEDGNYVLPPCRLT